MEILGLTLIVVGAALIVIFGVYMLTNDEEDEPTNGGGGVVPPDDGGGKEEPDPVDQPVEKPSPGTPIAKKAFPDLDIPQRALDALKEEGFESVEDVRAVEDLTSINGIGDSYAEDIKEALSEE